MGLINFELRICNFWNGVLILQKLNEWAMVQELKLNTGNWFVPGFHSCVVENGSALKTASEIIVFLLWKSFKKNSINCLESKLS